MESQKTSSKFIEILQLLQHKRQKKVQISITIDEDILTEITKITTDTGISRAEVINSLLRYAFFSKDK